LVSRLATCCCSAFAFSLAVSRLQQSKFQPSAHYRDYNCLSHSVRSTGRWSGVARGSSANGSRTGRTANSRCGGRGVTQTPNDFCGELSSLESMAVFDGGIAGAAAWSPYGKLAHGFLGVARVFGQIAGTWRGAAGFA